MPSHLVLSRHGESEANVIRAALKDGDDSLFTSADFQSRADHEHRLTLRGIEQAKAAGEWITRFIMQQYDLDFFDQYHCSPYMRPMETAGHMGLPLPENDGWRLTYLVRERDYGEMEALTREEFKRQYPNSDRKRTIDPMFWTPPGGESAAGVAESRVREQHDAMARKIPGGSAIIVTHNDYMWATRIALERPTPRQWRAWEQDPSQKMYNGHVLHFTDMHPTTGEVMPSIQFLRSVCPWKDPDNPGTWQEIPRHRYANDELLGMVATMPRIIIPES
jgi:broad specificity phosphatase PhoE